VCSPQGSTGGITTSRRNRAASTGTMLNSSRSTTEIGNDARGNVKARMRLRPPATDLAPPVRQRVVNENRNTPIRRNPRKFSILRSLSRMSPKMTKYVRPSTIGLRISHALPSRFSRVPLLALARASATRK